ncbi:uncharacterized protein RHIMIDRAFT_76399 [Rhizopus microsporus ATCC 52813]|uniref:Uncharacterized protein n=1 Tax=Rhizopus microsporus ATCC 52813 TaxID=1340429 RepID=A0A2G4SI94_RHIZD|nr:uncharacterized protein RHIMIDRAFT_76399 [Rhizopus microsporus ATCC 52813]PHZ08462.1 hypothetical protein RHIMIDRAFT_76399 [Rhizopus microsporus ATCC 52813]
MNLALIGHNSCAKDMSYSIQNLVITMNDFGVRMTDSEFISDDDVNSLSEDSFLSQTKSFSSVYTTVF